MTVSTKEEAFHSVNAAIERAKYPILSGIPEREHVDAMRVIELEKHNEEQAENEDMQFERAMKYACQMMQRRISTTAKENATVEEKVATAEGSMTNRIMVTEFHKSHDVATKLVSNDNTGVLEPKRRLRIFGRKTSKGQLYKSAKEGRTVPRRSGVIERSSKCWRSKSAETGRVLPKRSSIRAHHRWTLRPAAERSSKGEPSKSAD